jgi:hypothetical protein
VGRSGEHRENAFATTSLPPQPGACTEQFFDFYELFAKSKKVKPVDRRRLLALSISRACHRQMGAFLFGTLISGAEDTPQFLGISISL